MTDEDPTQDCTQAEEEAPSTPTEKPRQSYIPTNSSLTDKEEKRSFFKLVADFPWPFLLIVPIAYALIIAFGWASDNKVETSTEKLWIEDDGAYAMNQAYAEEFDMRHMGVSSFLAMAVTRDNSNILTSSQLEEIRARMEKVENETTVRFESDCALFF